MRYRLQWSKLKAYEMSTPTMVQWSMTPINFHVIVMAACLLSLIPWIQCFLEPKNGNVLITKEVTQRIVSQAVLFCTELYAV